MSDTQDYTEQMIRTDMARRIGQEGLEPLDIPKFLTRDESLVSVFYEFKRDDNGDIQYGDDGQALTYFPRENEILFKTMLLLNSHLSRTGNMTSNEAELFRRKVKRIFLMLEAEQDEDSYEGELWALYEDIVLHLEGAVRDNINGWRGKLLTVKEWYAHLSTSNGGKGRLGGLFRRK